MSGIWETAEGLLILIHIRTCTACTSEGAIDAVVIDTTSVFCSDAVELTA